MDEYIHCFVLNVPWSDEVLHVVIAKAKLIVFFTVYGYVVVGLRRVLARSLTSLEESLGWIFWSLDESLGWIFWSLDQSIPPLNSFKRFM